MEGVLSASSAAEELVADAAIGSGCDDTRTGVKRRRKNPLLGDSARASGGDDRPGTSAGSGAKGKEVVENLDPRLNTESVLTLSVPGWTHLPVPPKYRVAGPLKESSPFVYMQMLHALAPPPVSPGVGDLVLRKQKEWIESHRHLFCEKEKLDTGSHNFAIFTCQGNEGDPGYCGRLWMGRIASRMRPREDVKEGIPAACRFCSLHRDRRLWKVSPEAFGQLVCVIGYPSLTPEEEEDIRQHGHEWSTQTASSIMAMRRCSKASKLCQTFPVGFGHETEMQQNEFIEKYRDTSVDPYTLTPQATYFCVWQCRMVEGTDLTGPFCGRRFTATVCSRMYAGKIKSGCPYCRTSKNGSLKDRNPPLFGQLVCILGLRQSREILDIVDGLGIDKKMSLRRSLLNEMARHFPLGNTAEYRQKQEEWIAHFFNPTIKLDSIGARSSQSAVWECRGNGSRFCGHRWIENVCLRVGKNDVEIHGCPFCKARADGSVMHDVRKPRKDKKKR